MLKTVETGCAIECLNSEIVKVYKRDKMYINIKREARKRLNYQYINAPLISFVYLSSAIKTLRSLQLAAIRTWNTRWELKKKNKKKRKNLIHSITQRSIIMIIRRYDRADDGSSNSDSGHLDIAPRPSINLHSVCFSRENTGHYYKFELFLKHLTGPQTGSRALLVRWYQTYM
jgi:hypothetical protein